jgi:hypothetical protein
MSVDFPSSYPATAAAGKPSEIQTLQEAFAAALRSYGTEKAGSQTDTMLEGMRAPSQADDATGKDRNQQRQEHQQHANRSDFTNIDRKAQNQSELRHGEMNSDYRNRVDRHTTLQNDHQAKLEHRELQRPAIQTETSQSGTPGNPPPNVALPNESIPTANPSSLSQVATPGAVAANSLALPVSAAPNVAAIGNPAGVFMPMNVSTPAVSAAAPQTLPTQVVTVFTTSGRFGQNQDKADEKEDESESEESTEETPRKKKQPFAAFEAIREEATRPTRRNQSRQPQETADKAELSRITEKPREKLPEKPKEIEPDRLQNVKTLDEFLNVPAQSVVATKKGESNQPDQTQYLHRVAAACEAAAHHAPIRIKVNLDHLGTLTLRFFYKADKLTLRFETPSKESEQFLRNNLDGLQTILKKRNVKIVSVEVLQMDGNA